MKVFFYIALFLVQFQGIYAQNEVDVLRYSTTDIFGSARFEAMAGSFGALGADLSAIQISPASMGRFSSSTASLSFNNSILRNEGIYNGTEVSSGRNKFTLGNIGVVFANDISERTRGRLYNQITLAYTRLKNFANERTYEGQNYYSLLDVLANDGYGVDPVFIYDERPFTTGLAYDILGVNYDPTTGEYYSLLTAGDMYHHRKIQTDGGMGEFHLGYSENYMNILYYGISLGVRNIKYEENYHHNEKVLEPGAPSLRSFEYLYEQTTKGVGFNLKLGVMYLPIDQFRVGLAFETPTVFRLTDKWSANMIGVHNYGVEEIHPAYIPRGEYKYRLTTPMKLRGSFAYILGTRGAVNVDLEMSRLSRGKLRSQNTGEFLVAGYDFAVENQEVKNQFRTILNTRIGFEYMIFNNFYGRLGLGILPQPYKKGVGSINIPNMTYAGGVGWENRFIYLDLSYRLLKLSEDYYAFDPSKIENRTMFHTNVHNIVFTFGVKF